MQLLERRGPTEAATLDEDAGTIEVVASTFADVQRNGYVERLDPQGFDPAGLVGKPVLDSHQRSVLASLLGVVTAARIEAGKLLATLRLSARARDLLADIKAGIKPACSIGYSVERWRTDGPVRTAAAWTVHEVSLCALGADAGAVVRLEEAIMPDTDTPPAAETREQTDLAIRGLVTAARLPGALADELIGLEMSREEARKHVLERWQQRQAAEPRIDSIRSAGYDDPGFRARAMGEALYSRVAPDHQPNEPARPYVGLSMVELAREGLRQGGHNVTGLGAATLIERALSTSDLPVALTEATRRSVASAYQRPGSALRGLAGSRTVPDYRSRKFVRLSELDPLVRRNEGGEVRYSDVDEQAESVAVVNWARGLRFTREAMINDDLGLLGDVPARLGRAARETEDQQLVNVLVGSGGVGVTMGDGKALFHTDHSNLAGSGAAIDETTLSAARLAMRRQTDGRGNRVAVNPQWLVVPPDLETTAQKQLSAIQAAEVANVNAFTGLRLLVEPRLTDQGRWYLAGEGVEGLVIVRLEGRAGPQVDSAVDFDTKSVKFSVLNDFAVLALDWRGWYLNPDS
ncbi:MAG TPA: Mu-like prophage major head subunit gpT family protein [Rhodospirillales bacterium]|nr:Mu-like prophage major head subunit gpT family protein [Rhodospirillales bacterium]